MIVLVIMAAATAVVWPNLQKPLRRTSLTESASLVRELLDHARQRAATHGDAHFVRFQANSNQLYVGTLPQFLEDRSLTSQAGEGSSGSAVSSLSNFGFSGSQTPPLQMRQLAGSVVVSRLRNTIVDNSAAFQADSLPPSSPDESLFASAVEGPVDDPMNAGSNSSIYWLPMLAGNLGRDATITLFDTQLNDSIDITYCATTGAIEILP